MGENLDLSHQSSTYLSLIIFSNINHYFFLIPMKIFCFCRTKVGSNSEAAIRVAYIQNVDAIRNCEYICHI